MIKKEMVIFFIVITMSSFSYAYITDGLIHYYSFDNDTEPYYDYVSNTIGNHVWVNNLNEVNYYNTTTNGFNGSGIVKNLDSGESDDFYDIIQTNWTGTENVTLAYWSKCDIGNQKSTYLSFHEVYDSAFDYSDGGYYLQSSGDVSSYCGCRFRLYNISWESSVSNFSDYESYGVFSSSLNNGDWYLCAGGYNDETKEVFVALNDERYNYTSNIEMIVTDTTNARIGDDISSLNDSFSGAGADGHTSDEFFMWNRVIDQDELETLYNNGVSYDFLATYGVSINSSTPDNATYTYSEGTNITFTVDVDSVATFSVEWFLNSVSQAFGNFWTWVTGGDDASTGNNIEAIVTDIDNNTVSESWSVDITDYNEGPQVQSLGTSEPLIFNNIDYYISCEISDNWNDTDDLSVEIKYNDGDGWVLLNSSYNGGNEWISENITSHIAHDVGDLVSYSCLGTDSDTVPLNGPWYILFDYKTVLRNQTAPTAPTVLLPYDSRNKISIPVICTGGSDEDIDGQNLAYELQVRKNNTGDWYSIRNASSIIAYSYNIFGDAYNTTYDFRCRSYDDIDYSDFTYNYNASIKANIPVFKLTHSGDYNVRIEGRPYQESFYVDFEALSDDDISIVNTFAECNNDGLTDYHWEHNNIGSTERTFTCINKAGIIKHTVGVVLYKDNTEAWTSICRELPYTEQYCKITKTYEVEII